MSPSSKGRPQKRAAFDPQSFLSWPYPVLAQLSLGYSRLKGRLLMYYAPVRRCTQGPKPPFSLDLHVLSTPPAFALSQDQTLMLNCFWKQATEAALLINFSTILSTDPSLT